ncbi:MAG: hypothetical protein EON58_20180 [Alphaproteobacteria bacterium]|nr:MAG: hypothetical protein EON58_20180 [Alphaproteobacteria bacterium]
MRLAPGAPITFGDRKVPLNSLKSAERVSIRLNSAGEGVAMAVITPTDPNVVPTYPSDGTTPNPAPAPAPPSQP